MDYIRFHHIVLSIAVLTILAATRFLDLNTFVTADENRWQANVAGFTTKLSQGRIGELLQQPHPGITTQWFASPTIWAHTWAGEKVTLILAQCILLLFAGYLTALLWGKKTALFAIAILALDPFLIAHTRVYAMDSLLAIFCLLSVLSLLVWHKTLHTRYIVFAGAAASLAFLSKLSGLLLVPYALGTIIMVVAHKNWKKIFQAYGIWLLAFFITSFAVLPSFAVRPLGVIGDMGSFFESGDYTVLHQYGTFYYIGTLLFLSTPIYMAACILIVANYKKIVTSKNKRELFILISFASAFVIIMTLGAKKGDRYILPAFLFFDVLTAYAISAFWSRKRFTWASMLIVVALALHIADLVRLHPYYLAYVNPITKPFISNRQLGWGEGLNLAADYINKKPNASNMTIAMYYASQFKNRFAGHAIPLHQYESPSANYAITYRAMYGRGDDAWETDVLNHFKNIAPEKTININGIPYVWIYNLK